MGIQPSLDKKLGEGASMEEKKEREKERGGSTKLKEVKRERSWTLKFVSKDSHSSKFMLKDKWRKSLGRTKKSEKKEVMRG